MKRKFLVFMLVTVTAFCLAFSFSACENSDNDDNAGEAGTHTEGLQYEISADGTSYAVTGMGTATDTEISVPKTYGGLPVTAIGDFAFAYKSEFTKVTIPDGVTSVGSHAFAFCNALTTVIVSDTVTEIGTYAFRACGALTNVTLGGGVTTIDDRAFHSCSGLVSLSIPESVKLIGAYAFQNCTSLKSLVFENPVGWYASSSKTAANGSEYNLSNSEAVVIRFTNLDVNRYWHCTSKTADA